MGSGQTACQTRWRRALLPMIVGGAVALAGVGPIAQDVPAPSGAITGRIVDRASVGLPGVTVAATRADRSFSAVTDEGGSYRLSDLPPGVYQISATLPGFVQASGPSRAAVIWAGRTTELDLWMIAEQRGGGDEEAREFQLRQLDREMRRWRDAAVGDHRLVVEKECFCADASAPETVEALFEHVARAIDQRPDAFEVVYDARYGLPSFLRVDPSREFVDDELTLRVTAFEPMARESAVRGRILDLDRQPLAGAEVTLARGDQRLSATTGDDGVFYIEAPPGAYRLSASRPRLAMSDPGALVLVWDGRETTGSWQLVPEAMLTGRPVSSEPIAGNAAALTGRVVDESGAAIPGVTVTVGDGPALGKVVTNVRGEFALTDLPAGVHTLTASLTGFASSTRQVELVPARRTEIGVLMSIGRGPSSEEERERRIAELDAMLTRWRASRPAAYAYTVSRSDGPDRVTVHVGGHVATFNPDLPAGRAYLFEHYAGMDKLFERIAWAIERRAGLFAVRYDPDYGHPLSIVVDVERFAVHDELDLRVSDFRPVY